MPESRDIFNEKLVRKLPDGKDYLLKGLMGLSVIAIITAALLYAGVMVVPIAIAAVAGFIFLSKFFEVEYEYILTNDELDVDKIVNKERRSSILTASVKDFELFAPCTPEYRNDPACRNIAKTVDVSTHSKAPNRWMAVYEAEGVRTMLIFEPGSKMREGIRQQNPRVCKGIGPGKTL